MIVIEFILRLRDYSKETTSAVSAPAKGWNEGLGPDEAKLEMSAMTNIRQPEFKGKTSFRRQAPRLSLILIIVAPIMIAIATDNTCGEDNMNKQKDTEKVLHSRLAGTWYTSDAQELKKEIDRCIEQADAERIENVIALILPHAGYAYSGPTAGFGISQLSGKKFERVVVLGPTHRYAMRNMVSMPVATHYETPLGKIPLDAEFIDRLVEQPFAARNSEAHLDEHSVQIQLPMLQGVLADFKLVPIVCGQLDLATTMRLGGTLRKMIDDKTLVVASSDFTHFGPRFGYTPFQEDIPDSIKRLDMEAFSKIKQKNAKNFIEYVDRTGATICGRVPIGVLLTMLPKESQVYLLEYDTSGRMTGDYGNTVSYLSAAVTGRWKPVENRQNSDESEQDEPEQDSELSEHDKQQLLKLARSTLLNFMTVGSRPSPAELGIDLTEGMQQTMGAFVTLHKDGQLRGCIGEIKPRRPLYRAVMDHAVNAALNDPRFPEVKSSEIEKIDFEISALTPPREVASYDEIEIGKHGIVLQKGLRAAVFLPQVAPEQGWGLAETLTHLAMKAGLPPDGWREGASFEVFEAIVFAEK